MGHECTPESREHDGPGGTGRTQGREARAIGTCTAFPVRSTLCGRKISRAPSGAVDSLENNSPSLCRDVKDPRERKGSGKSVTATEQSASWLRALLSPLHRAKRR